ncbi:hypothetical protein LA02_1711 [Francisella philomiragia]|uniref:hypothetical protein n=1 Tax=Francisella philomiragia TaxID=28110 RepID=UPI0005A56284|nr:hypothetical protein [Francisella philomiragia]AJI57038.1 hypothetical protein LA02_1711 [Francisella philomiragia]
MLVRVQNELPIEFFDIFESNNIIFTIEYVDYTIARSIKTFFDEWVDEISYKENQIFNF